MVRGGVEPAPTAGLSPPCPGATASEAFLAGPAVGLVQGLSPLACPTETGFCSQSISLCGHAFRFVIAHPGGLVPALTGVTFQRRHT